MTVIERAPQAVGVAAPPLEQEGASGSRFDAWAARLRALAEGADEAGMAAALLRIHRVATDGHVTVTFGGYFSSGKSTLVNAVLGRPLLPVSDYPETGALCVLRAGAVDAAMVQSADGPRAIPLTTEAIAREITLISDLGDRRDGVARVQRVDMLLRDGVIPPRAVWIDSPGINDSAEMDERALQAARRADVLLWILTSRRALSETEVAFLARYVSERGPASVRLLLNVFLDVDTPAAWERFVAGKWSYYGKLAGYKAPEIGFSAEAPPELLAVSARALGSFPGDGFGGYELRQLLASLAAPSHWRVRQARLARAAVALAALADQIDSRIAAERERLAGEQAARAQRQAELDARRQAFDRAITGLVDAAQQAWSSKARAAASQLAAGVTTAALTRDTSYGTALTAAFAEATQAVAQQLTADVVNEAFLHNQQPLAAAGACALRDALGAGAVAIEVPNTSVRGGAVASGAAAGFAIGTIVPGIGHVVGPVAGALYGLMRSGQKAVEADVAGTKANIAAAAEHAVTVLLGRKAQLVAAILEQCADPAAEPLGPMPDEAALHRLVRLGEDVRRLADDAATEA